MSRISKCTPEAVRTKPTRRFRSYFSISQHVELDTDQCSPAIQ